MAAPEDLRLDQRDDGTWAVMRGDEVLSVHDRQAGAMAELTQIARRPEVASGEVDADDDPFGLTSHDSGDIGA